MVSLIQLEHHYVQWRSQTKFYEGAKIGEILLTKKRENCSHEFNSVTRTLYNTCMRQGRTSDIPLIHLKKVNF